VNLSVWRFVVIAFEKQWAGGRARKIVCILGQQKKVVHHHHFSPAAAFVLRSFLPVSSL
jgi:hypothetical protein